MMEHIIVYGIGQKCRELLDTFPKLKKCVITFVDTYSDMKELYGVPVIKPDALFDKKYRNKKIMILTGMKYYDEIHEKLISKYEFDEKQIISSGKWLLELLKTEKEGVLFLPKKVRLDISTICQLHCPGCGMRIDSMGIGTGFLPFKQFRVFIDENPFIAQIEISNWGEPFLNPDIDLILEYSHKKNIEIMISNGTNFNDVSETTLEALVKYQVRHMTISIDGASQRVYEIYRKGGNFNKVVNNIKKLNRFKKKYNTNFPKLTWQFILMNHNEHEADMAKKLAQELNMEIWYKLDARGGFVPRNPQWLQEVTGISIFNREASHEKKGRPYLVSDMCRQMITSPQINFDGRLLGCCNTMKSDWKKNVFTEGFIESINTSEYKNAIIALLSGQNEGLVENTSPCGMCPYFISAIENGNALIL